MGQSEGGTVALILYRGLWEALSPAASLLLKRRAARGKEDRSRLNERRGHGSRMRPPGPLIWVHGASVGESLAILPLVSAVLQRPERHVLVTTGTVTSARLMSERLPAMAFHQFVPIDDRASVCRFLDHWRPDLALFAESELWPNLILETRARKIPMALVNARLSERSARRWGYARGLSRRLLGAFDICLAQDDHSASRLTALGARSVEICGNLKADAQPLPVDEAALVALRAAAGSRPVFLAASTHVGEEEIVLEAAKAIRKAASSTLTIIVPRHPQRGNAIEAMAREAGFATARRAAGALPLPETNVYVADTLGELGLFYRLVQFSFLGGSLIAHGGQNPLEAARLGTAVLTGPHTHNFEDIFRALLAAQGWGLVNSSIDLAELVIKLIGDPDSVSQAGANARLAAESLGGALAKTVMAAERLLDHARA